MIHWNRLSGLVISFIVFVGCSSAPSKDVIETIILNYLESDYYKVADLTIGHIEDIPAGKNEKGFIVKVPSLTLEFTRDTGEPLNYKKGFYLTFNDVLIRMEKSKDKEEEWIITNVSGIPLL